MAGANATGLLTSPRDASAKRYTMGAHTVNAVESTASSIRAPADDGRSLSAPPRTGGENIDPILGDASHDGRVVSAPWAVNTWLQVLSGKTGTRVRCMSNVISLPTMGVMPPTWKGSRPRL